MSRVGTTFGAGITLGQGITIGSSSGCGPAPSGIEVTFAEFDPTGLTGGSDIEDPSGTFSSRGFTINGANGNGSGVAMSNLLPATISAFNSNAYGEGYIWNVTWASGSTYHTTPVAMYFDPSDGGSIVFWILNPSDNTYSTPVGVGTFNYPAYFTSTTTPTSFTN
jgi:hypothetical protein